MTQFASLPSIDELTADYRARCAELSKDIHNLLPSWAQQERIDLFNNRKIIICGSFSRPEIRVLAKTAEVIAIVDDFNSGDVYGIPIIPSDVWIDRVRNDKSIVSCILTPRSNGYNFFMRRCMEWDLPFLDPLHIIHLIKMNKIDTRRETGRFFMYGYEFFQFALEHSARLLQLCDKLTDSYSRFSWLCLLMYRITLNPYYLDACCVGMNFERFGLDSYQINRRFFQFSDQEIYVDGGAHTGETVQHFMKAVNGRFKHIYAFEPMSEHMQAIRNRLNWQQQFYIDRLEDRITLTQKGLWSHEGALHFTANHTWQADMSFGVNRTDMVAAAHFVESGFGSYLFEDAILGDEPLELPVTSIDAATNRDATFIKLEIEGSELKALEGARETIARNRPLISLALYHKPDDYVTLVEFMLNTGLDYKLGFRHHHTEGPESDVLYCYP